MGRNILAFWRYFAALCRMLLGNFAESFLTAAESFEEADTRAYKASFGNPEELLSSGNGGFCLTGTDDGCISRKLGYSGVMVIGSVGSGKGAGIVIPSCLRMKGASMIVIDP